MCRQELTLHAPAVDILSIVYKNNCHVCEDTVMITTPSHRRPRPLCACEHAHEMYEVC